MVKKFFSNLISLFVYYLFPDFVHQIRQDLRWAIYRNKKINNFEKKNIEKIIKNHFSVLVSNIIEILLLDFMSENRFKKIVNVIDEKYLDESLNSGNGVILLIAHYGNWEYIGYWLSKIKKVNIASFYLDQYLKVLDNFLNSGRLKRGIKLIHRTHMKEAVKHLKSGGVLAIISDQDGLSTGEYINFFGRIVSAPKGVARFSEKFNCRVVPVYIYRNLRNYSHNIVFHKPFIPKSDETIRDKVEKYYKYYESIILKNPHEWLWPYKRWKTRRHVVRYLSSLSKQ